MRQEKQRVSYRLSARTLSLLEILAERHDTTFTRIIEEAIREKARREKVTLTGVSASSHPDSAEELEDAAA